MSTGETMIRVEGLGKLYRIGALEEQSGRTLRDVVAHGFGRRAKRLYDFVRGRSLSALPEAEKLWALRDINFDVSRGDVVGVVGRNGSGKSTLLKILSRITGPTEGRARIVGRVGSLLEVGTGFHPELTGRENIHLNGAILGMGRAEIRAKLDEIIAFSEIERFVDTPVKHYSSGMYLRLAFSVAAHLDPEILLIDEILAVGDAAFQKRCLGKMRDVASEGRTVLFVSHNLATVRELCDRGIVLHHGRLVGLGNIVDALNTYARVREADAEREAGEAATGWTQVELRGGRADEGYDRLAPEEPFEIEARFAPATAHGGGQIYCIVTNAMGQTIVHRRVHTRELGVESVARDGYRVRVGFPALWLAPGLYTAHFKFLAESAGSGSGRFVSERMLLDVSGSSEGNANAAIQPDIRWSLEKL
jgi:lipopolysaccharide transport system ATP-binding protein